MQPHIEKSRFDAMLPAEQKRYFKRAMDIGGFRTLTEFVFTSAQEKADRIIEHHNSIISTKKDREIFFSTLMNPPEPNSQLKEALSDYKEQLKSK